MARNRTCDYNGGMITLIVTLAVVGLIVGPILTYIPMPSVFKTAIIVVSVICLLCYLLNAFGIVGHDISVPRIR